MKLLASLAREGRFCLASGTDLALRLGHLRSKDLDWFMQFEAADYRARCRRDLIALQQEAPRTVALVT